MQINFEFWCQISYKMVVKIQMNSTFMIMMFFFYDNLYNDDRRIRDSNITDTLTIITQSIMIIIVHYIYDDWKQSIRRFYHGWLARKCKPVL